MNEENHPDHNQQPTKIEREVIIHTLVLDHLPLVSAHLLLEHTIQNLTQEILQLRREVGQPTGKIILTAAFEVPDQDPTYPSDPFDLPPSAA